MVEAGVVALMLAFQGAAAFPVVVAQFVVNGAMFLSFLAGETRCGRSGRCFLTVPTRGTPLSIEESARTKLRDDFVNRSSWVVMSPGNCVDSGNLPDVNRQVRF